MIRVFIAPVPLVAGRLDGHVRLRNHIGIVQQLEGRDRDNHQDNHRDNRPQDLDRRIVGGPAGIGVRPLIELDDHPDQQKQDEYADQGNDDQQQVMEADNLFHQRRRGILKIGLPGLRQLRHCRAGHGKRSKQREKAENSNCNRHHVSSVLMRSAFIRTPDLYAHG